MSKQLHDEAYRVAQEFVRDSGYVDYHIVSGSGALPDGKGLMFIWWVEARQGPHATRKTPVEHFRVSVRITGPNHKTFRATFMTERPSQ